MKKIIFALICLATLPQAAIQAATIEVPPVILNSKQEEKKAVRGAILEAIVNILPSKPIEANPHVIQPGTDVQIQVIVKNTGDAPSAPGSLFARFRLPENFKKTVNDVVYNSEHITIPSIDPGKTLEITFRAEHLTPSLLEFVRADWGMRQYQAVLRIDGQDYVLGHGSLTFSCYYYPTTPQEEPTSVPVAPKKS